LAKLKSRDKFLAPVTPPKARLLLSPETYLTFGCDQLEPELSRLLLE
jgi:hypothetical protein